MSRITEMVKISKEFSANPIYSGVKKDCFGYSSIKNRCSVLTDTYCKHEECKFYKTRKEFEKGNKNND